MKGTVVLIGAGSIGQAIARRVGAGRHVVLADLRLETAEAAGSRWKTRASRPARLPPTSPAGAPERLGWCATLPLPAVTESVAKEPGVICIFPMRRKDAPNLIRIVEIYRDEAAYQAHLRTPHFLKYKEGTLAMVKSLELVPMQPLDAENMDQIFRKQPY